MGFVWRKKACDELGKHEGAACAECTAISQPSLVVRRVINLGDRQAAAGRVS